MCWYGQCWGPRRFQSILPLSSQVFYEFAENPFGQTSDPRFFYPSPSHARAFEDLSRAVQRRESICALTGEIGTGKTTLCRTILHHLPRHTVSAFVHEPAVSREDLLKMVLVDFGAVAVDEIAGGRLRGATRTELSYLLGDFLNGLAPDSGFAVVFVEEAQNLSAAALEELRIMADSDGQLQLVLVGQPQLRSRLAQPEMRQLEQRISTSCELAPLECDAVGGYIAHRLGLAGASPDRPQFTADAVTAIHRAACGIPRLVNRLCDRVLREASLAEAITIDRALVDAVLVESVTVPPVAPSFAPATARASDPITSWLDNVDESPIESRVAALDLDDLTEDARPGVSTGADPFAAGSRSFRLPPSPRRVTTFAERFLRTTREVVSAVMRVNLSDRHRPVLFTPPRPKS